MIQVLASTFYFLGLVEYGEAAGKGAIFEPLIIRLIAVSAGSFAYMTLTNVIKFRKGTVDRWRPETWRIIAIAMAVGGVIAVLIHPFSLWALLTIAGRPGVKVIFWSCLLVGIRSINYKTLITRDTLDRELSTLRELLWSIPPIAIWACVAGASPHFLQTIVDPWWAALVVCSVVYQLLNYKGLKVSDPVAWSTWFGATLLISWYIEGGWPTSWVQIFGLGISIFGMGFLNTGTVPPALRRWLARARAFRFHAFNLAWSWGRFALFLSMSWWLQPAAIQSPASLSGALTFSAAAFLTLFHGREALLGLVLAIAGRVHPGTFDPALLRRSEEALGRPPVILAAAEMTALAREHGHPWMPFGHFALTDPESGRVVLSRFLVERQNNAILRRAQEIFLEDILDREKFQADLFRGLHAGVVARLPAAALFLLIDICRPLALLGNHRSPTGVTARELIPAGIGRRLMPLRTVLASA